jgi:NAD(P)-dependent dehydrogenase (short-subunit alcohol dehydrogenase family)
VSALTLDLCDFDSIKAFPPALERVLNKKPIDVLMNNAGVMALQSREITKDGLERTFQTNHVGHFVLTAKLLPQLANNARIINVSSEGK